MKNIFFLSTLFLVLTNSYSQKITKGDILKDRQFLIDKRELTASDTLGNFVAIRPHRINGSLNNYLVEFYEDLNFTERIEIETVKNSEILKVFLLNNKAHVFLKETNNKTTTLKINSIDLSTKIKTVTVLYKISKSDNKQIYKALKNSFYINLDIHSDVILSFPYSIDKKNRAIIKVFSTNFDVKSEIDTAPESLPRYKHVSYLNIKASNNKIYALFQLNNNLDDNHYHLIELMYNGKVERSQNIKIPNNSYELINTKISENHLILAGLYSNKKKGGYIGFTYYNIDLDTFEVNSKQTPFYNEKATNYFSGIFNRNRDIDINNIFINDQMETYIVGQFYIKKKQSLPIGIPIASFAFAGGTLFITYNPISVTSKIYDDILVCKIDNKGKLKWDSILALRETEKQKTNSNKRDLSTFTFFENDKVNILMNGIFKRNSSGLVFKQDKRPSKTNFYNVTINEYGEIDQNIIFSNTDSKILFKAENATISESSLYVMGQGNMRKQLLKLEF